MLSVCLEVRAEVSKSALSEQGVSSDFEPCPDIAKKQQNQSSPTLSLKQAQKAMEEAEGSLAADLEAWLGVLYSLVTLQIFQHLLG